MHPSLLIPIHDKSQAGEARRLARAWTLEATGDEDHMARVALIVTELANNLHLHTTRGGVLLLRKLQQNKHLGVEILALDDGPGTANFGAFLRDGFSMSGTSGTGLGAVQRTSHRFEVHSQPNVGTALLSQLWTKNPPDQPLRWQVGAVNLPRRDETVSGDAWCFTGEEGRPGRLVVADGLGHGPAAAEASRQVLDAFSAARGEPLAGLMDAMHRAAQPTRGAAVAVAEIDPRYGSVRYLGVGNVAATLVTREKTHSLPSMNGIVGARCDRTRTFDYPWLPGSLLVMASDGLKTNWNLGRYTGLTGKHPALIAGVLYRDFQRGTDDTTVAVVRAGENK